MTQEFNVRWTWLKAMYIYTILGAGGLGLGLLLVPDIIHTMLGWPNQDQVISFGLTGSIYLSFGLLSILGMRSPLKYSPLLLLQLCYKVTWLVAVALPALLSGDFPAYAIILVTIFATYIIGDLIAIPFAYVFRKEALR